jgi:L-ornithine Nalpha-acyltransferase
MIGQVGRHEPVILQRAETLAHAQLLSKGQYRARLAQSQADITAAHELRSRAFGTVELDQDSFDVRCLHVLIEDTTADNLLVCCFRMLVLAGGDEIGLSYSAQFYDLAALKGFQGKMVEIGRFCIDPDRTDPDILRVAWGAMTAYVDQNEIEMLFGCSSFAGTETESYLDTFAVLKHRYLAPSRWLPRVKAPDVFRYAARLRRKPDSKKAMLRMPPLLRTYLMMGGWVSDHAVIDRHMNTLHVFTGLEIAAIPPARKRLLRALA